MPAGKADLAVLLRLSAMRWRSLLQATNIQGGDGLQEGGKEEEDKAAWGKGLICLFCH